MKAGQVLKLAGQNYLNSIADHHREAATNQLNVVLEAAEHFNNDLARVSEDENLSAEGQAEASHKIAAAALATLKAIETTTIKTLADRAESLEKSLLSKVSFTPPTDPARQIVLQEIRSQIRELSASERLSIYLSTTDQMILAAIETAPVGTVSAPRPDGSRRLEHLVDPEQIAQARFERAAKADPATAQTLREVRSLREIYSHAVNAVRREIEAEVPAVAV